MFFLPTVVYGYEVVSFSSRVVPLLLLLLLLLLAMKRDEAGKGQMVRSVDFGQELRNPVTPAYVYN